MTIDHEATEGDGGKSVQSQPSNRYSEATLSVSVEAELDALGVWHVDVYVNGEGVGGGTTPEYPLDLANDVLYGDKNDWLNGDHGALGNLLRVRAAEAMSE